MENVESSGSDGFTLFDFLVWAAVIVGLVLLIRFLSKAEVGPPAEAIGKAAAVPFSPWFPLR